MLIILNDSADFDTIDYGVFWISLHEFGTESLNFAEFAPEGGTEELLLDNLAFMILIPQGSILSSMVFTMKLL